MVAQTDFDSGQNTTYLLVKHLSVLARDMAAGDRSEAYGNGGNQKDNVERSSLAWQSQFFIRYVKRRVSGVQPLVPYHRSTENPAEKGIQHYYHCGVHPRCDSQIYLQYSGRRL